MKKSNRAWKHHADLSFHKTIAAKKMGRQQGAYANVPVAASGGGDDDDVVVPVATAVTASDLYDTTSSSLHGSSVHSSNLHLPTASKIDVAAGGSTNAKDGKKGNPHDVEGGGGDDNDGVTITWEKGEVQPTAFRDVWFAVVFIVHLVAVIGDGVYFGPAALSSSYLRAAGR